MEIFALSLLAGIIIGVFFSYCGIAEEYSRKEHIIDALHKCNYKLEAENRRIHCILLDVMKSPDDDTDKLNIMHDNKYTSCEQNDMQEEQKVD